ncbi:MAG: M1 family metallopeptidase [Bacteroidota bacterium]|nr:M1 family metallopeptidase [Bacteroidota bacterium]
MKKIALLISVVALIASCTSLKKSGSASIESVNLDTVIVEMPNPERAHYNESNKRIHNLVHTKLDVKFDYSKARLNGNATLTLTPYFYSTSTLELDAKGFDIEKVALEDINKNHIELKYKYDGEKIKIDLDKVYSRTDTFNIYVKYTAKPDERETGGSEAITSDKGLYFINPDGKDSEKPIQIWTQGETEANSAWFPTIDSPNERMSQELYITVENKYVTLSNGTLMFSLENGDGTRTDYWKQNLPHAPYLTMMAIGEYAVVKDKWNNIDVHYYVEKEYEPYARNIFGNTPEMLEFYSKILGFEYPWDKYHQVVVRDYVSGAMENTGAVIFGEFMNKNDRELLDGDNESIVAHELFHHWFGDLVTCESWANLPLNESFATYGEYLWIEYKYGRDEADMHIHGNLNQYLAESKSKQVDMIRFDYQDKEDMFDSHSYAKGGRILHMLRKYVGDDAFFESLKLYLNTNKYTSVEMHQLRLAFEKVTGEDLNWFFNQWFFSSGHPEVKISTSYNDSLKQAIVSVEQQQDFSKTPVYKLPLEVDIYVAGKIDRHQIIVNKAFESFTFKLAQKPDLINVDAEKMLLGVKNEKKEIKEWVFQYLNAPLFLDRYEAIENLSAAVSDTAIAELFFKALSDKHWNIRLTALKSTKKIALIKEKETKIRLIEMAKNDNKSDVRAAAIKQLAINYKNSDESLLICREALKDSSYAVIGEGLSSMALINEKEAFNAAFQLENEKNPSILTSIAGIYAKYGDESHNDFYLKASKHVTGFNKYAFITIYGKYLKDKSNETVNKGLPLIEDVATNSSAWWMRLSGVQVLSELHSKYSTTEFELTEDLKKLSPGSEEELILRKKIKEATQQKEIVKNVLARIKEKETDKNMIQFLEAY